MLVNNPQPIPISPYTISYKPLPEEGECVLKIIYCMRRVTWRFILFVVLSIILGGIPALLGYWYIGFKRWMVYKFCPLERATHFYVYNYDKEYTIVKRQMGPMRHSDRQQSICIFFINRYMKYVYSPFTKHFQALVFNSQLRVIDFVKESKQFTGYNQQTVSALQQCYGHCVMELPRPSCAILAVREVLQPFYIFILYSVILWYCELYIYYASIILATSLTSIGINLYQVTQLNNKIYEMAYYTTPMLVLRNNQVLEKSSIDLVPGDIVFIQKSIKLPFDGVLLGGSVLMNESALTGQSVPIVKKAIDHDEFQHSETIDKSAYVYEGTLLVQVCSYSSNPVQIPYNKFGLMVMVNSTNFSTLKGQLIRTISFPRRRNIRFYHQAAKFIIFLFCLSVATYLILLFRLRSQVRTHDLVVKFFDLITITVPPGLPASMSIGIIYSLRRLKKKLIYCISPDRIISGGRVQHICFDKTGTLTEEFMDFYEFVPKIGISFKNPIRLIDKDLPENQYILEQKQSINALNNMASCHSIMKLEGTQKIIGDPMEIKLFEFGGYQLTDDSVVKKHFRQSLFSYKGPKSSGTVFRRFEFTSELQRMSVVGSSTSAPNSVYIYCKGAPESMLKIMKSESIPADYLRVQEKYTSCGFRVLAIASRELTIEKVASLNRQSAEKELSFDGFEVFENKLKLETEGAIRILRKANISTVIITGDNALTGTNIGFKSGVIDRELNAMIIDLDSNNNIIVKNFQEQIEENGGLAMQQVNYGEFAISQPQMGSQRPIQLPMKKIKSEQDFECTVQEIPTRAIQIGERGSYVFCITGVAFHEIFEEPLTLEKKEFMKYIRVFARTKPNDKTRAVVIYQSMGRVTAMCGDGANDCGALKQADAGLSLSEAEASISSPFTSKIPNITAMIVLIKECRGGLATNFSLFNIMALYSLIQYTTTVIVEFYYGYPADLQFLYWDVGCNFFFFLTIGYTASSNRLSKLRPSDTLFSFSNLTCVICMFLIQLMGQFLVIIVMNHTSFGSIIDFYQHGGSEANLAAYINNGNSFTHDTYEAQTLFIFSNFMYVFSVLAFTISRPWRKGFYTNPFFMMALVIILTYNILIAVVCGARFKSFMLSCFDSRFQFLLLGLGLSFGLGMYLVQKILLQNLFSWLRKRYPNAAWL